MSRKATDLAGKKFGVWTAARRDGRIGTNAAWLCRCEQGHERRIAANRLQGGDTTGCKLCRSERLDALYLRDAEFVRVWQTAAGTEEVAEQLGLTLQEARTIAARLRAHKVALKRMPPGPNRKADKHYAAMRALASEAPPGPTRPQSGAGAKGDE